MDKTLFYAGYKMRLLIATASVLLAIGSVFSVLCIANSRFDYTILGFFIMLFGMIALTSYFERKADFCIDHGTKTIISKTEAATEEKKTEEGFSLPFSAVENAEIMGREQLKELYDIKFCPKYALVIYTADLCKIVGLTWFCPEQREAILAEMKKLKNCGGASAAEDAGADEEKKGMGKTSLLIICGIAATAMSFIYKFASPNPNGGILALLMVADAFLLFLNSFALGSTSEAERKGNSVINAFLYCALYLLFFMALVPSVIFEGNVTLEILVSTFEYAVFLGPCLIVLLPVYYLVCLVLE